MTVSKSYLIRSVSFFIIVSAIFLFSPKVVLAQVVINEFSSNSDPEWVELYNNGDIEASLEGCTLFLDDNHGIQKIGFDSSDTISAETKFKVVEKGFYGWNSFWLNNDGDEIYLNCPARDDSIAYGNQSGALIEAPGSGKSGGRSTDGDGSWVIFSAPTKGTSNAAASPEPTPTSTSSPTPSSTPTSTPTAASATYKINEVKDEGGATLANVKVYLDGVYLHHFAPETLTFCDSCQCDTYVACGFGQHTVKLERSGFQDWSQMLTINAGETQEVNPVMKKLASTGSPTASPTAKPGVTSLGPASVLGATNPSLPLNRLLDTSRPTTAAGFFPLLTDEAASPESLPSPGQQTIISFLLIGGGLVVMVASAVLFLKQKRD